MAVSAVARWGAQSLSPERTGLSIRLDAEPVDTELSPEAGLAVYRIVQEALSNTVRHASAGSVGVYVTRGEDGFVAEVHDDGTGFDVEAAPDAGTRVRLEMPAAAIRSIQPELGGGVRMNEMLEVPGAVGDEPVAGA